jgi:hypothetical protein
MNTIATFPATCDNCDKEFQTDGFQWVCNDCHHPPRACPCGSDDLRLDWDVIQPLVSEPVWRVECQVCEKQTAYCETAKEAYTAWMNGEALTPIPGTDHFEEAW